VGRRVVVLLTLLIAYRQYLPFAFEQLDAGRSLDCKVIPEGEGLLFHVQDIFLRIAKLWEDTQRWVEWDELCHGEYSGSVC
jgi:hypothetical protein